MSPERKRSVIEGNSSSCREQYASNSQFTPLAIAAYKE